jgi:hypothetical protein
MGDAATLARAAALLGELVHSNEPPDMIEIDNKEKLFNSALRLEPTTLLALLCARLGVPAPATLKRNGPWDGLLEGVAAHFGWSIMRMHLFSHDVKPTGQPRKMQQWIRTASFTPEAVDRLLRELEEENDDVDDNEGDQEDDEEEEEKFTPRDAVGTMRGVSVARAGAAAVQKVDGGNSDAAATAGAASTATGKQQEGEKAKEAAAAGVAAAETNSGEEKEVEKAGGEQSAEYNVGETDADKAGKAAEVADGSAGPAKEKEEEEESNAVPGSGAKEDTAAGGGSSGGKQDVAGVGGGGIKDALREEIAVVSNQSWKAMTARKRWRRFPVQCKGRFCCQARDGRSWAIPGSICPTASTYPMPLLIRATA